MSASSDTITEMNEMSDCEFCGSTNADEHYLETPHRFTIAHKTYGSIYVCDTCIGDGLKLLQKQLKSITFPV